MCFFHRLSRVVLCLKMGKLFLPKYKTNYYCLKVTVAAGLSNTDVEICVDPNDQSVNKLPR